jgi:hypothetical protein
MVRNAGDRGRPPPAFARTEPEAVFGVLRGRRPLSIEEMEAAVLAEARRRAGELREPLQSGGGGRKVSAGGDEPAGD